jgi:thiaminase II
MADQEARFTVQAWAAIAEWRQAVETMPFIRALGDGSLPVEAFGFYLAQDAAYLREFSRVLAAASTIAPDQRGQAFFAASANVAIEVESALHYEWLADHPLESEDAEPSPVTVAYTNHLLAITASGAYPLVVAAVLPCYWLYAHIGEVIVAQAGDLSGHPYATWIGTYADEAFREAARTACELADEAAATADPALRQRMLAAFVRSSMHEYPFFEQGLDKPRWPTPPNS